ncbi:MAG: hypothetical protein V1809_01860 [Planctomycetota bacterium]
MIRTERNGGEAPKTAMQAYAERQQDIGALMDLIGEEIRVHADAAAKDPAAWGYAGDLGRIRESLKDTLQSFLIGRHGWSATEASRFIEDHLEEIRGK